MHWALEISVGVALTLAALVAWAMNVLGMPGNWLAVAMGVGAYFLAAPDSSVHVGLVTLAIMLFAALLGELLEFAASALGASRLGASKRASALAIVGAMAGAIFGLFAGSVIPVPIVGQVIGSLLFGSIGAAAGAVGGERWVGKSWDESLQVGHAAFWGRLLGTVGKAVCGTLACVVFMVAIWS
jgi:uncharacterized protein YqgC (DUF456 family)